MIIGIDASRALSPQSTGTERYSLEIIRHLLADPEARTHTWRLYVPHPVDPGLFAPVGAEPAPFDLCLLRQTRAWTHRRLGPEIRRRRLDVLFVPAHVLPLGVRLFPPMVVTVHDLGYLHFPHAHPVLSRIYLRWSTNDAARRATRLIAVSEATRRDLIAHTCAHPDRICVVHEAATPVPEVSPAQIEATQARFGLARPYALFVGTLQPRKNIARLVEAYAMLLARGNAVFDLVLVGRTGWLNETLVANIERLAPAGRVHRLGYVAQEHLPALLRGARMFCYPSLYEGFGLPILEAHSAGVPVLTATNSSLPEVAGDAALLVDATNVEAIADAMLRLSRDDELRAQLVKAGYANIKRFSWQKAARETLAVLQAAARAAK